MTCKPSLLLLLLLLLSCVTGCVAREPGTSVEVEVAAVSSTPDARSQLTSDLGYHVRLEQLYIVLSRIELVPCPGAQRATVWRELWGRSVAHAHGQNTMTSWAVPNVIAPLADSTPVSIAVLHPPAIAYCSIRVALDAADADAERMPPEIDMNGLSMFMTGTYGMDAQHAGLSFLYDSYVSSSMVLPFAAPIVLSEDNLHIKLRIDFAYQHMLDGLTLFPGAFSTFGDVVLAQALTHATAAVLTAPP
jgi:hypothetical protein